MFSGGSTKVGGLNRILEEWFLGESNVVFSFDSTWLILVIGTPYHGLKTEF